MRPILAVVKIYCPATKRNSSSKAVASWQYAYAFYAMQQQMTEDGKARGKIVGKSLAKGAQDDGGAEAMGRRVILMEIFIESQQSAQWAS